MTTQERRAFIRESLPVFTEIADPIHLRLRLPSGQVLSLQLPKDTTADYLFNFVESHESDLGFEDETARNFDILQPL